MMMFSARDMPMKSNIYLDFLPLLLEPMDVAFVKSAPLLGILNCFTQLLIALEKKLDQYERRFFSFLQSKNSSRLPMDNLTKDQVCPKGLNLLFKSTFKRKWRFLISEFHLCSK
jgi:hypothetical protein